MATYRAYHLDRRRRIQNGQWLEAPNDAAASSNSAPRFSITGCTVRTVNGKPTKASATAMPIGA